MRILKLNFRFKEHKQREPLNEALKLLLPLAYERMVEILPNESEESVLLQKQIMKIVFSYVEYFLCLDIVSKVVFHQWMEIAKQILQRPVPDVCIHTIVSIIFYVPYMQMKCIYWCFNYYSV